MKIKEVIYDICHWNNLEYNEESVDKYYSGSEENEVTRVVVTMFASIEVIRKAIDLGAELLIVHEPTYYSNEETIDLENPAHKEKVRLLEESGLTIFRYHNHPHHMAEDFIDIATIKHSKLKGKITGKFHWAVTGFELDEPMTAEEVRCALRDNLNAKWTRVAGETDKKGKVIAFACGTPGNMMTMLLNDKIDFIVTGEACEWIYCEMAKDLASIGKNKALIVMGHCRSEYAGMIEVAERLQKNYSNLEVYHIESGDAYK